MVSMPRFKLITTIGTPWLVINYQYELQPSTFEHAVHCLIEHNLDLSVSHANYRNDATARLSMMQLFYKFITL